MHKHTAHTNWGQFSLHREMLWYRAPMQGTLYWTYIADPAPECANGQTSLFTLFCHMFTLHMVELNTLYNQEKMGSWESQFPSDELGGAARGGVWWKAGFSSATLLAESFIILGVSSFWIRCFLWEGPYLGLELKRHLFITEIELPSTCWLSCLV